MTDLSLVYPYYLNPGMLTLQFEAWAAWPKKLKARIEIVIVDDGSPETPAFDVPRPEGLPPLSIYRVTEDRPWHQHAARNLGAKVADGPWLLLTDMDHVLPPESAASLLRWIDSGRLHPQAVYMLDRIEADTGLPTLDANGRLKPHPNSFVMSRDVYWKIGGYDEDLCGLYGTDSAYKARAFAIGHKGHLRHVKLVRYWRDLVPDASTTTLPRKEGRDPDAKKRVIAEKAARGEAGTVKVLQFPWERVL